MKTAPFRPVTVLLAGAVLLLASCASTTRVTLPDPAPVRAELEVLLAGRGPQAVSVEKGNRKGVDGCQVAFEVYRPADARTDILVVLGHGFASNLTWMRGWAERWASFGVPTAILSFCNVTLFNGRHDRNAEDMVALARALHDGPVLYGGFSAGGLAAFLATTADPRAAAYLGLDAVDTGDLALAARDEFRVPSLFLFAQPGPCNAKGSMLPAIPRRPTARALRVRNAVHGHFQDPYDPRAESLCGKVVPAEAAGSIMADIRSLATAWVLAVTGAMPEAAALLEAAASGAGDWKRRVEVP
jgi:pimeloyl-ACP methyl ester carboxylesterase